MNLAALDAAVRARGYSFLNAADDPTSPILILLNSVYREVCGNQRWPWLEKSMTLSTTSVGQYVYPLISSLADFRQLDAVRLVGSDGTNYDLTNMEPQTFKSATFAANSAPIQTGVPQYWTQYGGAVQLWPAPDGVYTILVDYIFTPPDLAALTDIPVLPAVYHDVLIWGTIQELAFRERNIWAQELAMGYYNTRYKAMQAEFLLMQRQTSSTVKRSGFNDDFDTWALMVGAGG